MADTDQEKIPAPPGEPVRQGEPTYGDTEVESAQRSRNREGQRYEDTGWTANPGLAQQPGPDLGASGQGQFGPGGFAGGGMGQSGYGDDFGQRQNAQDSFGGEEGARSSIKVER